MFLRTFSETTTSSQKLVRVAVAIHKSFLHFSRWRSLITDTIVASAVAIFITDHRTEFALIVLSSNTLLFVCIVAPTFTFCIADQWAWVNNITDSDALDLPMDCLIVAATVSILIADVGARVMNSMIAMVKANWSLSGRRMLGTDV